MAESYVAYKIKGSTQPKMLATFDGFYIQGRVLKDMIAKAKKIGQSRDVELALFNENNNEEFEDFDLIPRFSQVLVARRLIGPIEPLKAGEEEFQLLVPPAPDKCLTVDAAKKSNKNIANRQSENALSKIVNKTEFKHNVKRAAGIPKSSLLVVDGPNYRGALQVDGFFAVHKIEAMAHNAAKQPTKSPVSSHKPSDEIPKALRCHLCNELCKDAAVLACCPTKAFCDDCIRDSLLFNKDRCPLCSTRCTPVSIGPNLQVREAVKLFLN